MKKVYKTITENISLQPYLFDDTLKSIGEHISALKSKYGDDARIYMTHDEYEVEFTLRYDRLETDKERNARLFQLQNERERKKQHKKTVEESEIAEYKKLAAKYGKLYGLE